MAIAISIILFAAGVVLTWLSGYKADSKDCDATFLLGLLGLAMAILSCLIFTGAIVSIYEKSSICQVCGEVYDSEYQYCPVDGTKLEE